MRAKIKKKIPAYCQSCAKNVPHLLHPRNRFAHWMHSVSAQYPFLDRVLSFLRIGPWICFHCQQSVLILPKVNEQAQFYRLVDPDEIVEQPTNSITVWKQATPKQRGLELPEL